MKRILHIDNGSGYHKALLSQVAKGNLTWSIGGMQYEIVGFKAEAGSKSFELELKQLM